MSKIKLYKNSPLNVLGGRLQNVLRYQDIARAGAPQSLTGRAVMELGRLFTQMDMDDGEEEKPLSEQVGIEMDSYEDMKFEDQPEKEFDPNSVPVIQDDFEDEVDVTSPVTPVKDTTPVKEKVDVSYLGPIEELDNKPPTVGQHGSANSSKGVSNTNYKRAQVVEAIGKGFAGGLSADDELYDPNYYTSSPLTPEQLKAKLDKKTFQIKKSGKGHLDNFGKENKNTFYSDQVDAIRGGKGPTRLKSPMDRLSPMNRLDLQALDSDTVNLLEGLRYRRKGADNSPLHRAAHVSMSPFLDTESDSKIDYRYMKRATTPDYFAKTDGLAGSAAAGYNLVIDKANYNAAVKKDYEEEVTDAMGSLDVAPDLVKNDFTKDYFNLAAEYKTEYAGYHKQYANGEMTKIELEARRTNLSTKLSQVANAGKNLQTLRSEYLKNKPDYDIDASDTKMVDFYNTLEHDPNNLSVKQIDGVTYMVGKTKQGKDIKVPASKIADGTAGFRLVEKVDLTPLVTDALGTIQKYTEEGATKYGTGVKNADPVKAKKIAMASIMASLRGDENNLRSLMAQVYGVDHDTYQNFLGDDPKDNRQEILQDAAEHLYETQVKPQYFPKSKTSRFTGSNNGKSSQSERNVAALTNKLNDLPPPTAGNIKEYTSLFDGNYVIDQDDDGWFIGDFKNDNRIPLDLNDPVGTKRTIARYAGVKGYGLGNNKSNQTESDPLGIN